MIESNWLHVREPDRMLHWTQGASRLCSWLALGLIDHDEFERLHGLMVGPLVEMW